MNDLNIYSSSRNSTDIKHKERLHKENLALDIPRGGQAIKWSNA